MLPPQTKLREGNVFTGICLSMGEGGYLWSQICPGVRWVSLVPGPFQGAGGEGWVCLRYARVGWNPPPPGNGTWDITGYSRQAGVTHPTGMLSCSNYV